MFISVSNGFYLKDNPNSDYELFSCCQNIARSNRRQFYSGLLSPGFFHISSKISYKNLVLDQDNNFYLMSLNILITCLLDNV